MTSKQGQPSCNLSTSPSATSTPPIPTLLNRSHLPSFPRLSSLHLPNAISSAQNSNHNSSNCPNSRNMLQIYPPVTVTQGPLHCIVKCVSDTPPRRQSFKNVIASKKDQWKICRDCNCGICFWKSFRNVRRRGNCSGSFMLSPGRGIVIFRLCMSGRFEGLVCSVARSEDG